MEKNKEIDILLERYYSGKTSLEEEKKIVAILSKENKKGSLSRHKILIESLNQIGFSNSNSYDSNFDPFKKLDNQLQKKRFKIQNYTYLKYAAIVVFMIGSFMLGRFTNSNVSKEISSLNIELKNLQVDLMTIKLKQTMAGERIEALMIAQSLAKDERIRSVIENTALNDDNINVRLMSLNLLMQFHDKNDIKETLINSFLEQDSPIMRTEILRILENEEIKLTKEEIEILKTQLETDSRLNDKINSLYQII